jgi:hypothetical protein
MSKVAAFHGLHDPEKTAPRYHIDDACPEGQRTPQREIREGSGGFFLCERCAALAAQQAFGARRAVADPAAANASGATALRVTV